jgi:class 3 adenylate cyclase
LAWHRNGVSVFTDIGGSTRLLGSRGEEYRGILERYAEILRAAIADGGGTEVSTEGDAFSRQL